MWVRRIHGAALSRFRRHGPLGERRGGWTKQQVPESVAASESAPTPVAAQDTTDSASGTIDAAAVRAIFAAAIRERHADQKKRLSESLTNVMMA